MTDPPPGSDDLGVVDPIRSPEFVAVLGRRLQDLPLYALGFVLAAVVRTVLEVANWVDASSADAGATILALVLGSLPGTVVLLIPVAVAWSMQARGATSERAIRGSVAVGLSELAHIAAGLLWADDGSTVLASAALSIGGSFLFGGGVLWMAQGLEAIRQIEPSSLARRAGLGVGLSGVVLAALQLAIGLLLLSGAIPGPGSDAFDQAMFIGQVTTLTNSVLILLGWAYLARALIRGRDDPDRPRTATLAGAVSGWLAGTWFLTVAIILVAYLPWALASPGELRPEPPQGGFFIALSFVGLACQLGALAALAWGLVSGLAFDAEAEAEYRDQDEAARSAESRPTG